MNVLVDTSVWIDYWRGGPHGKTLDILIDKNLIVINEIILSEILPTLTVQGHKELAALLRLLPVHPVSIDWDEIRLMQIQCLKKGFNGSGIPDLIVAQNAIEHNTLLYTLDKHFRWLTQTTPLKLFS